MEPSVQQPATVRSDAPPRTREQLRVAIIGTGFAGICMGIKLKQAGIKNFTLYEKADDLGGTWRDNTYPGSGCDVPSMLYSFSFETKPDWSYKFAKHDEILSYLKHCAEKYGIVPHIRFKTPIAGAAFDADRGVWKLETGSGDSIEADILVSGTGQLNRPLIPQIKGMERFAGAQFHSAQWDHDFDLTGKRVAVIGNGASALQFIPQIAPQVEHLSLFQRSAYWVVPKPDRPYNALDRLLFKSALYRKLYRLSIYLSLEMRWPAFSGGRFVGSFFAGQATRQLKKVIADPQLQQMLIPDYPVGCKRILLSDNYYQALARENVSVTNSAITAIDERSVKTADGRSCEVDAIIWGTGFAATEFLAPMKITGLGGESLEEVWRDGAEAMLGITVAKFPNLFMLYGPNTNLGHNSIIFMIECQVAYAMQCIEKIIADKLAYVDVKAEAMAAYNKQIQAQLKNTVWDAGCSSWYKTESGKITNNWAHGTIYYRRQTKRVDFSQYDCVRGG